MDAARFVEHLRAGGLRGELAHVQEIPARPASNGGAPEGLDPRVEAALGERGLLPLYAHQTRAVEAALRGRDVALVTPTASGKSLCYRVPVAQALLTDPSARALYLFPTKAASNGSIPSFS